MNEEKFNIDRILGDGITDRIIRKIIEDLSDRKGIKSFWKDMFYSNSECDYDVLCEIVDNWRDIIEKEIRNEKQKTYR